METIFQLLAENFDLPILDGIALHLQSEFLDAVMPLITMLGNGGIVWIGLSLVLMVKPRYRRTGIAMAIAMAMGLVVCNLIMKPVFARIRPYDYQLQYFGKTIFLLIPAQHDFSFPSGHTLASFEAATALLLGSKKMGIPALILACLIAFSRLYLYVHYPSDVIFSILMGVAFGCLAHFLTRKIQ